PISIARPSAPVGDGLPVYRVGQVVLADYSCADDAAGVACTGSVPDGTPIDTSTVGTHTFVVNASDGARNTASASRSYTVVYDFGGFEAPLAPFPSPAVVKAGDTLPVKFSLHGDFGLDAVESIGSRPISCATVAALDDATPATGTLSYSGGPGRYTFQWATDRLWNGTCRQLVVALDDGTAQRANVRFGK